MITPSHALPRLARSVRPLHRRVRTLRFAAENTFPRGVTKKKRPWLKLTLIALLGGIPIALDFGPQKIGALWRHVTHAGDAKADATRRADILKKIQTDLVPAGQVITWRRFADIVDHIATVNTSDEDFRRDLWHFFGTSGTLSNRLDPNNTGLPHPLRNTGYAQEQMHHYLGGTTGTQSFPTNTLNNAICAYLWELGEYAGSKDPSHQWNQGDINLFAATRRHRDDFLREGRHTVADNIRSLLISEK